MHYVTHSEQDRKAKVRHSRQDLIAGSLYDPGMRLRIKQLRQDRGWTVETLAAKVGMSRSYVSEIENHRKTVNSTRIAAFAKAFGVMPTELINESTVSPEFSDHLRRLERLTPEDRESVFRHAIALDGANTGE